MKARIFQLMFVLMVVGALFSVGCGGSGSSGSPAMVDDSPIGKVEQIVSNWRASGGMMLMKTESGELKLVDSALAQTTPVSEEEYYFDDHHGEYAEPIGTLVFKDLSGETWNLEIMSVDYLSNINARVNTRYISHEGTLFSSLKIVFIMFKDRGEWFLNDMEVTQVPVTEPVVDRYLVSGTTFKHDFVEGDSSQAGVEMLLTNTLNSQLVYRSTTNTEGKFSFSVPAGNYSLTVSPDSDYMFAESGETIALVINSDYVIEQSLMLIPRSTPQPQTYSITGQIVKEPKLSSDTDESGIVMVLYGLEDEIIRTSNPTDASGYFSFADLPAGNYQLMTSEGASYRFPLEVDYIPITIVDQNVNLGEPLVVVPLDYPGPGSFRVTGALIKSQLKDGDTFDTPVAFYALPSEATETTQAVYVGETAADGSFEFFLQSGNYIIFVNPEETGYLIIGDAGSTGEPEGYVQFNLTADMNLGNISLMPFIIQEVYAIAGFLTEEGPDANPIEGALIQVTSSDYPDFLGQTVSAYNGYYFVQVPGPGEYTMVISRDGYETQTEIVTVEEQAVAVSVRLGRR